MFPTNAKVNEVYEAYIMNEVVCKRYDIVNFPKRKRKDGMNLWNPIKKTNLYSTSSLTLEIAMKHE